MPKHKKITAKIGKREGIVPTYISNKRIIYINTSKRKKKNKVDYVQ